MGKKGLFDNMNLTDKSYLLEPESIEEGIESGELKESVISMKKISFFKGHPFKVNTDTPDFEELVDSIKENGLIYPILVRPTKGDKYEIISGHRRYAACKEVGMTEISAIVRPLDDYEATILMVHSNLYRPEISISERAKAYRMCMDAEKHQGKKGLDTAAAMGEEVSDSRRTVYRYIRLSYLSDELLEKVDEKSINMNIGIELSYLDMDAQVGIFKFISEYNKIPNLAQAAELRAMYEDSGDISFEDITDVLLREEAPKPPTSISFKKKELQDYFGKDTSMDRISNVLHQLLQKYKDGLLDEFIE